MRLEEGQSTTDIFDSRFDVVLFTHKPQHQPNFERDCGADEISSEGEETKARWAVGNEVLQLLR